MVDIRRFVIEESFYFLVVSEKFNIMKIYNS